MHKTGFKAALAMVVAIALMSGIVLYGCGGSNDTVLRKSTAGDSAKMSLRFFGFKADAMNLTAIENAIQSFMDKNKGVSVSYDSLKGDEYETALDKRDEAGELDDIFMIHHDHVLSMGAQNKLADLSDLPGLDNFTDEVRAQFTNPDGSVYFLPTTNSTYNLYINTDLLEQHGQKVPENWTEFKHVCDYFVSQGITPIIANNRNSLTSLILSKGLFELYQQPDEQVEAKLAEFKANPELFAETLAPGVTLAAEMVENGWIDAKEALATNQTSDDLDLFVVGDRPFMITGGWASSRVMAKNPSFNYGVYPYPILDDGSVLSGQVDICISVNANSPHVEEAKAFVAHLINPDVIWDFCDTQASFTPIKDNRIPSEKTLAPSVDYLTNGRVVLRSEYRLDLPTETAVSAAAKALLNGESAQAAQDALLKELQD